MYKIETMRLGDYDAVLQLWKATEGVGLNESDTRTAIAAYLKRNPKMSFVARSGPEIIGAVLCGHDGRRGYLHHLAVARAHRQKGVGRKLVNAGLAGLRRRKIHKANIFLFASNAAGEKFWRRNGWLKRADLGMMQKVLSPARESRDG